MEKVDFIRDFIDINKLPIQSIKDLDYIEYAFSECNVLDKWENFLEYIESRFETKEKYRIYYREVKESFLKYTKSLPEFREFMEKDISKFAFDFPKGVSKANQYAEENVGKNLLSIDLKKANFQALRYCGVFKEFETYEKLMEKFTDIPFLIQSKYLRSVIFGQLNPGRHITVESWLVNSIRPEISDRLNLLCMASDELVYEVPKDIIILRHELDGTVEEIKNKYGLEISAEYYKLNEYILESEKSKKQYKVFSKESLTGGTTEYKCIPNNLWLVFQKLNTGRSLIDYDLWIEHDGVLSKYLENFILYEKTISN